MEHLGLSIAADVRQVDRPGSKQPESKLIVLAMVWCPESSLLHESVHAAVGPSIAADVRQVDRPGLKQPESKLDVLMRAHGVSRDVAERYLMACDDKIGDTHKMLQASRVRAALCPWIASSSDQLCCLKSVTPCCKYAVQQVSMTVSSCILLHGLAVSASGITPAIHPHVRPRAAFALYQGALTECLTKG